MASLKEIKSRIVSVENTLKITSAMKMVASAKLHKVENVTRNLSMYKNSLFGILKSLCDDVKLHSASIYTIPHESKNNVALIAFSSNGSLCGNFNNEIIDILKKTVEKYRSEGVNNLVIFPIGEKVTKAVQKAGLKTDLSFNNMAEAVSFNDTAAVSRYMMSKFNECAFDEISVVYTQFISAGQHKAVSEVFLPLTAGQLLSGNVADGESKINRDFNDYILEPSGEAILEHLLPYALNSKMYDMHLSSNASEYASRMVAMQTASDNAAELLDDLKLNYNKKRQQNITEELTDISNAS